MSPACSDPCKGESLMLGLRHPVARLAPLPVSGPYLTLSSWSSLCPCHLWTSPYPRLPRTHTELTSCQSHATKDPGDRKFTERINRDDHRNSTHAGARKPELMLGPSPCPHTNCSLVSVPHQRNGDNNAACAQGVGRMRKYVGGEIV